MSPIVGVIRPKSRSNPIKSSVSESGLAQLPTESDQFKKCSFEERIMQLQIIIAFITKSFLVSNFLASK